MNVPDTSAIQELFEWSGRARPTFSSESLLHAAWGLAFEPYPDACAAGGETAAARELLEAMRVRGVPPSARCFHHAARAYAAAGEWRGALAVWQDMVRQDMRPSPETWGVVHAACVAAGRDEEAQMLLTFAEREGVPLVGIAEIPE